MSSDYTAMVLKRFDRPDEIREMSLGRFELVRLGGMTIGRATYQPGWRWSEHVGRSLGQSHCKVEHIGFVLTGAATAAFTDGRVIEMRAGDIFYILPTLMTLGWSGTSPTSPCTFSAQTTTQSDLVHTWISPLTPWLSARTKNALSVDVDFGCFPRFPGANR